MEKSLKDLLDSLNKGTKEDKEENETDLEARSHAKLVFDMMKTHEEKYGAASMSALVSALVVAAFKLALNHAHMREAEKVIGKGNH